ncbi:glycosyltransferase family 2 protein (plasmid) [Pseudorhodobacter turbinis]|uniref:Glycosyltransferase family 2 protein n=1 Tax=Pseudorhodobacter turbinis TaxID=2500533 RepID=A0A4P8EIR9_9RHOB|nr:glycosyltransferase family 2 protein [Pseudorhodobacter turbinis]QCO56876.1 glycosyltransferase family 2 protein [Pseudorhodobacter turbinis]
MLAGTGLLLDCVRVSPDRVHAFFGAGVKVAGFAPDARSGCALPLDLRDVSGAALVTVQASDAVHLARADGSILTLEPTLAEPAFLAGRNCLLGFRMTETVAQTVEWLTYHARHHAATGAVIINRLPDDGFRADLAAALADMDMRVVFFDCAVPLGKPDLGPEDHVYLAPDAPGKDRMEPPVPNPWRAPLGEALIYEVVKWRFLQDARAVLTLDIPDFLAPKPAGAPSAFDLCASAKSGAIFLAGTRIYPWRVRNNTAPRIPDHICAAFDVTKPMVRWGVAPQKAGLSNTWRMLRVAYTNPDPTRAVPFFRAMAIKIPGRTASELAPKTSLVEQASLIAMAEGVFDHKPVRAPVSKIKPAPKAAERGGRTAIVTTMKNEGPFILEWLAYHRAIGVDDFLIYTNDCTDGTDTMLDLLQAKGIVQHRINPFTPGGDLKPQHAALQAAESEPVMQNCGWGICMDVDEFINIKIGNGTLPDLYKAMGEANMISLTWRLFGNDDVHDYEDRFITEQFTACAPEVIRKPHQAWGFKTLFRNIDMYKKLGVHRPKGLVPDLWDQVKWLNGSGRPLPRSMFRNGWRSTLDTYGYDWVQLNHYAVRSAQSFLVKRDRGRVNHVDRDQGLNYWFRMNHNIDQDDSIQRMIPALREQMDILLADPDIRAAHNHSVACHRAKITDLMQTENYQNFYAELTGPRMQALCRMQQHFGSAVFSAGPAVIPEDLHQRDLPADFFFTVDHKGEAEH